MNRVAVYAGTRNLYHAMSVAAYSLLVHTKMDRVIFLIEDDEFPEPLPDVIECINVSKQTYFQPDGPNFVTLWTYMTLMRLALPIMLPEEKRVLWLDVDTIVEEDISELFDTLMGDCYVAGVPEPSRCKEPFMYINTGVLLMDLEKLRDGKCNEFLGFVGKHILKFPDQDCINLLCQGKIKKLDFVWNSCPWTYEPDDRKIVHFAADRNYERRLLFKKYERAKDEGNQSV